MKYLKRMKLNAAEVAQIRRRLNNYIWVAVDVDKGVIAAGDEFLVDLRDSLIYKYHSRAKDIYGLGLDLSSGEVYYAPVVNRMNRAYRNLKIIPQKTRNRIETLMAYFFEDFAAFRSKPRHVYQAQSLQGSSR